MTPSVAVRASLVSLWVICTAPLAGAGADAPQATTALDSGESIGRHLAPGEAHHFTLTLAAGDVAGVSVRQQGIDVIVDVADPSGSLVESIQDEITKEGQERAEVVAEVAGTYTLTVRPAPGVLEPGDYTVRAARGGAATGSDRVRQQARSLRSRAQALEQAGRFDDARPLFEQALNVLQAAQGPDDVQVGLVLFDLAGNALERQDDTRARSLYERAIPVLEKAWGSDQPYPAMARSRLGLLYERAGQMQKAEALVRDAVPVLERSLGPGHPWSVQSLATLGNLRNDAGDLRQAEEIDRRALAILSRTGGTGTMLEAMLLNNLGEVRRQQRDYAAAESLTRRSLAIGEARRGPESYFVSTAFQNLGVIARERKDYAGAVAAYSRALSIRERLVGPYHPGLASLLNNLANVYRATGDGRRALETHFRALRIWETSLGPYARETLLSVGNIARTYASIGDVANALAFERRADAILEVQLSLNLAVGSERQKLAFERSVAERTDRTISLNLHEAPGDPEARALAALVLLQRKGRVQDAMADVFAGVRQRAGTPADRMLMDRLRETTAALARVVLEDGPEAGPCLAALEAEKERLEATLSEHNAEFRARMQPVTLAAVQAAIPDRAALLEFAVFRPFDPAAERNAEAYGPPHYAAYVVGPDGVALGVDLGAVDGIDALIRSLRDALHDPSVNDVRERAHALHERVLRPLLPALDGVTRLLISPDGDLSLVPFEALVGADGRYVIERYATTYLSSGRDLLRMQSRAGGGSATPGAPLVVADPWFGEPVPDRGFRPRSDARADRASRTAPPAAVMSRFYFAPLSGTAAEGRAIKALFPDATLVRGRSATKAAIQQVKAPRILHIASHGFFLDDDSVPGGGSNPLLRSGLALAGANVAHDAGILTALEAAGLDLWGTRLVTLSACDTGIGQVRDREGVYGLRRAFVLAGAETVVMSLWSVSDAVARETMVAYYAGLRAGLGRGDALRQAKLAMLKRTRLSHPYYWAAFIQSGEWAGLDGRR